jgi:hypothetical protein
MMVNKRAIIMEQMPDYAYLTAQAKRLFPNSHVIVSYPQDEVIHILIDDRLFVFEIGSEDEEYVFSNGDDCFKIPLMD